MSLRAVPLDEYDGPKVAIVVDREDAALIAALLDFYPSAHTGRGTERLRGYRMYPSEAHRAANEIRRARK